MKSLVEWVKKHPLPTAVGATLSVPTLVLLLLAVWYRENVALAQTFGTAAIAYLTLILIPVTGFYAWTTWKTLGVLRADFEARNRIEVRVVFRIDPKGSQVGRTVSGRGYLDFSNLSQVGIWVESILVIAETEGKAGSSLLMRVDSLVAAFTSRTIKLEKLLYDALTKIPELPESQQGYTGNVTATAYYRGHGKTYSETIELGELLVTSDGTVMKDIPV